MSLRCAHVRRYVFSHCDSNKRSFGKRAELWELIQLRDPTFVCVEVLRPSQPNRVMSSAVSLPNHTFTGQA